MYGSRLAVCVDAYSRRRILAPNLPTRATIAVKGFFCLPKKLRYGTCALPVSYRYIYLFLPFLLRPPCVAQATWPRVPTCSLSLRVPAASAIEASASTRRSHTHTNLTCSTNDMDVIALYSPGPDGSTTVDLLNGLSHWPHHAVPSSHMSLHWLAR